MDLEQRVTALEQEVQLLKNEIRATLLAMQEYLLNRAYSDLSGHVTDTSSYSNTSTQQNYPSSPANNQDYAQFAPPLPQQGQQSAQNNQPMVAYHPQPQAGNVPEPMVAADTPNVRKVSLEDLQQKHPSRQQSSLRPLYEPIGETQAHQLHDNVDFHWATQPQLEEDVRNLLKQHGIRKTRLIISTQFAEGKIDEQGHDLLLDYIARIEDIRRNTAHRQHVGQEKSVREPQPKNQTQAEPIPPKKSDSDKHEQGIVLRLIAGVANAGIGMRRSS